MKIIFLLNFLISILIFLVLSLNFFKHFKNRKMNEVISYLSFIGIFYFIIALFSILWFLDYFLYNSADYLFIYSLIIIIQTIFLFRITYLFSKNKKLFYFLFVYLFIFLSFFYGFGNFLNILLIASFLLNVILFFIFISRHDIYRKIGKLGLIFSILSLFFQILLIFKIGDIIFYSFVSNFFFFFLMYSFIKDLKKYSIHQNRGKKNTNKFFAFFRYLVFIITLTSFIFIGTLGMHEFGHFLISKYYGCEQTKIIFEKDFPYTESLCKYTNINNSLLVGGILIPFLIAIFLFIIGGNFLKEMSLLITGFNLIISNNDLVGLGVSDNLILLSIIFGVLFVIAGIMILAKSITEDYIKVVFNF